MNQNEEEVTPKRRLPWLTWEERFDLLDYFPVQPTFAIQKSLPWIGLAIGVWVVWALRIEVPSIFITRQTMKIVAACATIGALFVAAYWELYRRTMAYEIIEFRFFSARGVFFRTVSSGPFTPYWNYQVHQTGLDWLFNVWRMQFWGDFMRDDTIHRIPSLAPRDAMELFRFIEREMERQVSAAGGALEFERYLESLAESQPEPQA